MKKVVLITGASSGIGKYTALLLLKEGYIVYGAARRIDKMKEIEEAGANILSMDVTNEESVKNGVDKILEKEGKIDVLVNNAGYGSYGAIEDVPIEEAKRQFDVNIFGLARLTQLVLPKMRENKYGKIINIASIGGKIYSPLGGWYHATKFGLEGLSDCLRIETKEFGIDVIVIEPGGIETEWGGIAMDNALKTSGNTAYANTAQRFKNITDKFGVQAHPNVIAKLILKSIKAKKPKTRYSAGTMAKSSLFMRKIFTDRMFDRMLSFMSK